MKSEGLREFEIHIAEYGMKIAERPSLHFDQQMTLPGKEGYLKHM